MNVLRHLFYFVIMSGQRSGQWTNEWPCWLQEGACHLSPGVLKCARTHRARRVLWNIPTINHYHAPDFSVPLSLLLYSWLTFQGRRSYVFFLGPDPPTFWDGLFITASASNMTLTKVRYHSLNYVIHWERLRAINSCLHLFWPQLCKKNICAVSCVYACVWLAL